jgi:methyl-accepting chemotaxis protein
MSFSERLIPDEFKVDPMSYSRARILLGAAFFLMIISLVMGIKQFVQGRTLAAVVIFICGALMPLMVPILRKTKSLIITGNIITTILFFLISSLVLRFGGAVSLVAPWYTAVVILGVMMAGFRSGVIWSCLAFIVYTVIYVAQISGWDLTIPPLSVTGTFVNYTLLIVTVISLGLIYEKTSFGSQKNLALEKNKSQEMADNLSQAIDEISFVMGGVAEYDLSRVINGQYVGKLGELKDTVNRSLTIINDLVARLTSTSNEININSQQMYVSSQSLASGASMQASSLEEISSSMETVGSQSKSNDDTSEQVKQLTTQTLNEVRLGNDRMQTMLSSMSNINEKSQNVSKVIKVIDEIAFQTNLLALNAAVEAARAGKFGKGFAVVAEEVRSLAGRSSVAAKDTTELIESSMGEVENGVKNADHMAESLTTINESMDKINDLIGEISSASKEQSNSVREINQGITRVNEVVQQNASISEQSAGTAEKLSVHSSDLEQIITRFKLAT